ncbi:MAG: head-tail connector protein [Planctomycetaceae bacterium]
MIYTLVTGPSEPVTLTDVKSHSRISHDAEDTYLTMLISAARQYAEHYCQTSIGEQTWSYTGANWPDQLAHPPLASVDFAKYYISDVLTTWDSSGYRVDTSVPGKLVPVTEFPSVDDRPDAVQIQYGCGKSATDSVKLACLIMVSHWYEIREPVVTGTIVAKVPWSAHALLDSERWGDYS